MNPNFVTINVEQEEQDPDSILNFYRRCLTLRKKTETLISGSYMEYARYRRKLYVYERYSSKEQFLILCSFSDKPQHYQLPKDYDISKTTLVLCNYPEAGTIGTFRPYEVQVLRCPSVDHG